MTKIKLNCAECNEPIDAIIGTKPLCEHCKKDKFCVTCGYKTYSSRKERPVDCECAWEK